MPTRTIKMVRVLGQPRNVKAADKVPEIKTHTHKKKKKKKKDDYIKSKQWH